MHALVVSIKITSHIGDPVGPALFTDFSAPEVPVDNPVRCGQEFLFVPLRTIASLPFLSALVAEVGTTAAC